jgi:hypothetical protein
MEEIIAQLVDFELRAAAHVEWTGGPPWGPSEFRVTRAEASTVLERVINHPDAKLRIEDVIRVQDSMYMNLSGIHEIAQAALQTLEQYRSKVGE